VPSAASAPSFEPPPEREPRTPTIVAGALLLLLLPVGHMVVLPVGGATATGADALLLLLLLAWAFERATHPERARRLTRAMAGEREPGLPPRRYLVGLGVLATFGLWVATSGLWGFHLSYALAKGSATIALVLCAGALASSGIGWRRAVDAWLGGAAIALLVTAGLGFFGPGSIGDTVRQGGTGVMGLPFARVSGPFLHPNMFGDYLVVTALLLWGRWPTLEGWGRTAGLFLAGGLAGALALTTSTAWVGGGVAAALVGVRMARDGRRGAGSALAGVGLLVAVATFVALVAPLDVAAGPLHVVTTALRPAIWKSSLAAIALAPLRGVGAAPFLASAPDPAAGFTPALWDAHDAYLSVLGQFGIVGFLLVATGLWLAVSGVRRATLPSRPRAAVLLALLAAAVHALFLASEDLRHVWIVIGLLGVVSVGGAEGEDTEPEAPRR
jgi:O-antigen ligase